jgi:hypothetical protein
MGRFNSEGCSKEELSSTTFDIEDLSRNDLPERGYPSFLEGNGSIWVGGIAVVAAVIIGVFAYGSDNSGNNYAPVYTHDVSPAPVPTVMPAPSRRL